MASRTKGPDKIASIASMSDTSVDLLALHQESFHPDLYIDQFFDSVDLRPQMRWMLDQEHRIFGGLDPLGKGKMEGVSRTLVEIGTGPIPFNTASASMD